MGRKYAKDSGKRLTTWKDFRHWGTASKENYNQYIKCSAYEFPDYKNDPYDPHETQCWCERKPQYLANICADEGGDCLCKGRVIFGEKYPEHPPHDEEEDEGAHEGMIPMNSIEATKNKWTVNTVNGTGNMSC